MPSPALRETVRAAFAHYDADGSGAIDARELRALVSDLGGFLTDQDLAAALVVLDKDGDGCIDEAEFAAWWLAQNDDLDGDGDTGELERTMARLKGHGQARFHVDVHSAAWQGRLDVLRRLLGDADAEADVVNERDASEYGGHNTPLHYAAYQGHVDVCAALRGASVNATNSAGCTPLFLAAQQSRIDVVELLLKHGADMRIPSKEHKFTAVDVATTDAVLGAFRSLTGGAPLPPTAPTLSDAGDRRLRVEWRAPNERVDQVAPISGYKIKLCARQPGLPTRVVLAPANPTEWVVDDLAPEAEYVASVAAVNLHGASAFSAASAPMKTRRARPPPPTDLAARVVDGTQVELTWAVPEGIEAASHVVIQQSLDGAGEVWKTVATVEAARERQQGGEKARRPSRADVKASRIPTRDEMKSEEEEEEEDGGGLQADNKADERDDPSLEEKEPPPDDEDEFTYYPSDDDDKDEQEHKRQ
ncbi:hypothetical protein ATCC90586_001866 [Pythium insidiosum]|nr:hypothetical protein ATCC90586_001866 [Pythium insidiosum]